MTPPQTPDNSPCGHLSHLVGYRALFVATDAFRPLTPPTIETAHSRTLRYHRIASHLSL